MRKSSVVRWAGPEYEEEDGPWYLGKAKEEFHKRRTGQKPTAPPTGEEDPIQWARDCRNVEQDRDSDFGPEDYFEGALRGGIREEEHFDNLRETFLLIFLCLLISVLLYVRTRIVDRIRQDQNEGQQDEQRQADLGVFPPHGDPARDDWAIVR
ncbi:hypothetical protein H0H92_010323 [Tricholoma furcatifolium]|nr:hypothetical protein H0H92_010323 [Tricholoma furcatifolium]